MATTRLEKEDFEALYGNKSKFGLVLTFAVDLLNCGLLQMAFNEMRYHYHLRPQGLFRGLLTKEEPEMIFEMTEEDYKNSLSLLQKKIIYHTDPKIGYSFRQEEINTAERFIEQKFPETRRLYRLKSQEIRETSLNSANIDNVYRNFMQIKSRHYNIIYDVVWQSKDLVLKTEEDRYSQFFAY